MLSHQVEDVALIGRVAAGDADAFAELFRRRHGQIYRFALHMTSSPSIAEDVTQDVFLAVMSDAARYDAGRAGRASVAGTTFAGAPSATAGSSRSTTVVRTKALSESWPSRRTRSAT